MMRMPEALKEARRHRAAAAGPERPVAQAASSDGVRSAWTDPTGGWTYVPSRCPAMQAVEQRAIRVAPSSESVLILGETGVGKDLLARLIHQNSPRSGRPFVHLNCASLSESLLESELFGHMKGSYTGADETRPGQFEIASGSTLFLDEIGEIPARLQAKLLHVLQERKIYRVGGRRPLDVDVRVVAATNRNLARDIRSGAFRRDLFYRLGVITLQVPPLRQRFEDLEDLALHFLRHYSTIYNRPDLALPPPGLLEDLRSQAWPGNIRELENLIKRIILLGGGELASLELLQGLEGPAREGEEEHPAATGAEPRSLREASRIAVKRAERRLILQALTRTAWNRKKAARELGVSYRSLLYKIKDYTLRPGGSEEPMRLSS
jgi:transcriptional regulator with GAF, ATPase, and Fis domain